MVVRRKAVRVLEKMNYKTDPKIKAGVNNMSDNDLLATYRSCRRSLVMAMTGVTIDSTVSLVNPLYLTPTAMNAVQALVSSINFHRVKEEVDKRRKRTDFLERLKKEDHYIRDILSAALIKTTFITISAGTLDMLGVGDYLGEAVLTHALPIYHSAPDVAAQHVQAAIGYPTASPDRALIEAHPHLHAMDDALHTALEPISEQAGDITQDLFGLKLPDSVSWADLHLLIANGTSPADIIAVTGLQGLANEIGPLLVIEILQEEARMNWQRHHGVRPSSKVSRILTYMSFLN